MATKLPTWWTEPYPEVTTSKSATDYLDALGASLKRQKEDGKWKLTTGEQELALAEHPSELDSFILGFALAHLICERHGLIGRRSGPTAAMPPVSSSAAAEPEPAAEGDGAD